MQLVLGDRRPHGQPLVEEGREDVGSIPVGLGHLVKLEPLEKEVYNDVVQERLVVQDQVVLGADGDGVAAGRRELAIFLVLKEQTKAG